MRTHHVATREAEATLEVAGGGAPDAPPSRIELAIGAEAVVVRWRDRQGTHHVTDAPPAVARTLVAAVVGDGRVPMSVPPGPDHDVDDRVVDDALARTRRVLRLVVHHAVGAAVVSLAATSDALWLVAADADARPRARPVGVDEATAVVLRELLREQVLAGEQVFG